MNGLQSSLYTVALALCLFSTGILRGEKRRAGRPFAWFTVFLLVETLSFGLELLMVHPATPLKGLWLGLRMAVSLLVGPVVWLAVREHVEASRPRLRSMNRGHLWPVVVGVLAVVPLIQDAHLGVTYANPLQPISPFHSYLIHGAMLLCIGIFAVQVPFYLWRCRQLLLNHAGASNWLQFPLVLVFTTWLLGLLRTVQCAAHAPASLSVIFALTDVGVTVGAIYLLVRRTPGLASTGTVAAPAVGLQSRYARSALDATLRLRLKRKLESALALEAYYGDSLLNLRSLSQRIGEKPHYVSQVINQDLNSSFYELVNRYRIDAAKKILLDDPQKNVLEIALAVGFNAKSTFHTAFRQNTGMTPSEYRAANSEKSSTH